MQIGLEQDHRLFYRIRVEIPVGYQFLPDCRPDALPAGERDGWRRGTTENLSGGGLLLRGQIGALDMVGELIQGKNPVALSLEIPDGHGPVEALARVVWLEGLASDTLECRLGLRFLGLTRTHEDRIQQFVFDHLVGR